MSPSHVCRSTAFAFLVPLSLDAKEALKLRANMSLLENPELQETVAVKLESQLVAKLDYALLFGRRCLSFGSSRAAQVHFVPASDVDQHHFILHFDMHTAALLLTDASSHGVWVSDGATQAMKCLRNTTVPLSMTTAVHFGQNQRYQFRVVVTECAPERLISRLFEEYAQSVDFSTLQPIRRSSSSGSSAAVSTDKEGEIATKESIGEDPEASIARVKQRRRGSEGPRLTARRRAMPSCLSTGKGSSPGTEEGLGRRRRFVSTSDNLMYLKKNSLCPYMLPHTGAGTSSTPTPNY
jgi:hypothetical protein